MYIVFFQPSTFEGLSIIYHLLGGSPRFVDSQNKLGRLLFGAICVQYSGPK